MQTITAKQLHLETKTVLDQLEKGLRVLVTRNGREIARLEPVATPIEQNWEEVMREVWEAQSQVQSSEIGETPVLVERQHRRR